MLVLISQITSYTEDMTTFYHSMYKTQKIHRMSINKIKEIKKSE